MLEYFGTQPRGEMIKTDGIESLNFNLVLVLNHFLNLTQVLVVFFHEWNLQHALCSVLVKQRKRLGKLVQLVILNILVM